MYQKRTVSAAKRRQRLSELDRTELLPRAERFPYPLFQKRNVPSQTTLAIGRNFNSPLPK